MVVNRKKIKYRNICKIRWLKNKLRTEGETKAFATGFNMGWRARKIPPKEVVSETNRE